MTRMNSATSIAPNSSPEFQTLMVPSSALDAVEAVDRRHQRVDDDPLRVRGDLWYVPGIGAPSASSVVLAGRDDPGRRARRCTIRTNRIV